MRANEANQQHGKRSQDRCFLAKFSFPQLGSVQENRAAAFSHL